MRLLPNSCIFSPVAIFSAKISTIWNIFGTWGVVCLKKMSTGFTRRVSLVRIQYRPPEFLSYFQREFGSPFLFSFHFLYHDFSVIQSNLLHLGDMDGEVYPDFSLPAEFIAIAAAFKTKPSLNLFPIFETQQNRNVISTHQFLGRAPVQLIITQLLDRFEGVRSLVIES